MLLVGNKGDLESEYLYKKIFSVDKFLLMKANNLLKNVELNFLKQVLKQQIMLKKYLQKWHKQFLKKYIWVKQIQKMKILESKWEVKCLIKFHQIIKSYPTLNNKKIKQMNKRRKCLDAVENYLLTK